MIEFPPGADVIKLFMSLILPTSWLNSICPRRASKYGEDSGLYEKSIAVINDASRVVSEWHHNLDYHLQLSIVLLESSIMLLE